MSISIGPKARGVLEQARFTDLTGLSHVHGFNYQPSWGHDAPTIWLDCFDSARYRAELEGGLRHFPKMNAVRIWLGYGAYLQAPDQLATNFARAIDICSELDLLVVPALFTVWKGNPAFDPIDINQLPRCDFHATFSTYIETLVAPQRGNPTILAWDVCNEPTGAARILDRQVAASQQAWLNFIADTVKEVDPAARTCCGVVPDLGYEEMGESCSDIITPHLYGYPMWRMSRNQGLTDKSFREWFDVAVDLYMAKRRYVRPNSPVLSTETCWGSPIDEERAEIVADTLAILSKYGIGFLAHALMTSEVADLHLPPSDSPDKDGNLPDPRSMAFLNRDMSLRTGHEVFNQFAR